MYQLKNKNGITVYESEKSGNSLDAVPEMVEKGLPISNVNLSGMVFFGLNCATPITFTECDFTYTKFYGGYLRDCKFINCMFEGAQFVQTNLANNQFMYCKFDNVKFERCQMNCGYIASCVFNNVDFTESDLSHAQIAGEGFESCNLNGVKVEHGSFPATLVTLGMSDKDGGVIVYDIDNDRLFFDLSIITLDKYREKLLAGEILDAGSMKTDAVNIHLANIAYLGMRRDLLRLKRG